MNIIALEDKGPQCISDEEKHRQKPYGPWMSPVYSNEVTGKNHVNDDPQHETGGASGKRWGPQEGKKVRRVPLAEKYQGTLKYTE